MLSGFSLPHLIVLLIIILLVFGTKKLRTLGGDLGSTIKEFKKALSSDTEEKPAAPIDDHTSKDDQHKPS